MSKKSYIPKQDSITPYKDGKTIYEVSNWTIVRKNFIAGIGRSAGAWFFNIVIIGILAYILIPMLGNKIEELRTNFNNFGQEFMKQNQIEFKSFEKLTQDLNKHN